jgi:hypothetical protein
MAASISKFKQYTAVFLPTAGGVVFYLFLSAVILISNQVESIRNVLDLPGNIQLSRTAFHWAEKTLTGLIGQSRTTTLVVGLFWAVVGVVVYILLLRLAHFIVEVDDGLSQKGYVWPKGADRYAPLKRVAESVLFRGIAAVILLILIFGPVPLAIRGPVFVDLVGPNHVLQLVVWFFANVLLLHTIVVLARLVVQRRRLFG